MIYNLDLQMCILISAVMWLRGDGIVISLDMSERYFKGKVENNMEDWKNFVNFAQTFGSCANFFCTPVIKFVILNIVVKYIRL